MIWIVKGRRFFLRYSTLGDTPLSFDRLACIYVTTDVLFHQQPFNNIYTVNDKVSRR